jgi:uncharacterized membrane protein YeaQ/YmgE (transglycosylase-associated protein family)
MGIGGFILLLAGALVIGIAGQTIGRSHSGLEWLLVGFAAFVGGFVADVYMFARGWAEFDGLAYVPALIGAIIVAGIVELVYRSITKAPEVART